MNVFDDLASNFSGQPRPVGKTDLLVVQVSVWADRRLASLAIYRAGRRR
jgi:hypothetical protein